MARPSHSRCLMQDFWGVEFTQPRWCCHNPSGGMNDAKRRNSTFAMTAKLTVPFYRRSVTGVQPRGGTSHDANIYGFDIVGRWLPSGESRYYPRWQLRKSRCSGGADPGFL